jgi:hypothetical protein
MISTLFVAVRVDHKLVADDKGRNIGVQTLSYFEDMDDGTSYIESVAARDAHGKSWVSNQHGDPCFDPLNDEGLLPPDERFIVWDEDLEEDDPVLDRPSSVVASISLYSSKSEDPERPLLRSYQLCRTNPSVEDFRRVTTEGDREMVRQMAEGKSTL